MPRGDGKGRRGLRESLARAWTLGRLAGALLDDRLALETHVSDVLPGSLREGPGVSNRRTSSLGYGRRDRIGAGGPGDAAAQVEDVRHRLRGNRRQTARNLDDAP